MIAPITTNGLLKSVQYPLGLRNDSLVEGLLGSIYDRFNVSFKDSFDSDVFTELSSSRFSGADDEDYYYDSTGVEHEPKASYRLAKSHIQHLGTIYVNSLSINILIYI